MNLSSLFGSLGEDADPMGENAPEYIYQERVLGVAKEIRKLGLISLKQYKLFCAVWTEVNWKKTNIEDRVTRMLYAMYPQTLKSVEEIADSINEAVCRAKCYWDIRKNIPTWAEAISDALSDRQIDRWEQTVIDLGIPGERSANNPDAPPKGKLWM